MRCRIYKIRRFPVQHIAAPLPAVVVYQVEVVFGVGHYTALRLDEALLVDGEKLPLSKNEYRILWTLLQDKGTIVSREKLMEALWQTDSFVDENTLSVNMARLRKKLDGAGLTGFITTKIGAGYLVE